MKFSYDSNYFPPAPSVEIRLGVPDEALIIGPLPALVDTGADATIVPTHYLESLSLQVDNRKYLRSQWGERRLVDTYWLDIGIEGIRLPAIEVVADELGQEIILGRNLLNKLIITLNGPNHLLEIVE
jgi:predicted aspartyl protease